MSKTILVIGYVWPEPNSSAAGSHMLSLLRLFKKQNWRVVFATGAQKTLHMIDLEKEAIESVEILLNDSSFDKFAAELQPDFVIFDRFMSEEQFGWRVEEACPNAIRILDTEDLQCLRGAREKAVKAKREMTQADLFGELAQREIAAILRCDLSLIISDYEMQLLNEQFKLAPALLHHLPFMLEKQQLQIENKAFNERKHFVTIGNFRHAPNWDSVLYLQKIWPLIKKQLPDVELHIYGSYPPKKATQLNNPKTGFLVKGWAEDAKQVLTEARVCLAPLRFGAGIKGKFIDAMGAGTPSVTTPIGSEGMTGGLAWPGLVASVVENEVQEQVQAIAEAAIELYTNEKLWQQCQQAGAHLLQQGYDGEVLGAALIKRILELETNLTAHRLNNFNGAMLRHHSMRSTRFMSKWIETKNKLGELESKLDNGSKL